jgi:hypothetical protein
MAHYVVNLPRPDEFFKKGLFPAALTRSQYTTSISTTPRAMALRKSKPPALHFHHLLIALTLPLHFGRTRRGLI